METAFKTNNTWDRVLGRIESKVSHHSFRTWFKPTHFVQEDASSVTVRVPNAWFADWLRTHYLALIQNALNEVKRPGLTVVFQPETLGSSVAPAGPSADPVTADSQLSAAKLNPKYTFEKFVVSLPEVVATYHLTGAKDFLLHVVVKDDAHLRRQSGNHHPTRQPAKDRLCPYSPR